MSREVINIMETFEYTPKGVCSSKMLFEIEGDLILYIKIIGGCPGNSLGIRALTKGKTIDEIISKLNGIKCGYKDTSCPDQISVGLNQYKQKRDLK